MITKPISEFEDNPFDLSAKGHQCFYCGKFLQDPAVQWAGFHDGGGNIYLHEECVFLWYQPLMRDALELKYRGRSCWNQLASDSSPKKENQDDEGR